LIPDETKDISGTSSEDEITDIELLAVYSKFIQLFSKPFATLIHFLLSFCIKGFYFLYLSIKELKKLDMDFGQVGKYVVQSSWSGSSCSKWS
jgi:hypothetical protein